MTLSLSLSLSALCQTCVLEQLARCFLVGLFTNAREKVVAPACEGRELARRFFFSFPSRCLGLSNLSLDEEKRPPKGSVGGRREMSRTARGRAHATVETRERGRRRVDGCVGDD